MFCDDMIKRLYDLHVVNVSPIVNIDEFKEDVNRFAYIYRIFKRYSTDDKYLNHRLLVNHIIILYNVFGADVTDILIDNSPKEVKTYVFSLLELIERLPEQYSGMHCQSTLDKLKYLVINDENF